DLFSAEPLLKARSKAIIRICPHNVQSSLPVLRQGKVRNVDSCSFQEKGCFGQGIVEKNSDGLRDNIFERRRQITNYSPGGLCEPPDYTKPERSIVESIIKIKK